MIINFQQQEKAIEGAIQALLADISHLAPHPDLPDYRGPLFANGGDDGMLGGMILESMLGTSFMQVAGIDLNTAMEAASTYIQDRHGLSQNYALGQRNSLSGGFNAKASYGDLMKKFMADLPRRMGLEKSLALYKRKLYSLKKQALQRAPKLAA